MESRLVDVIEISETPRGVRKKASIEHETLVSLESEQIDPWSCS